MSRPARALWIEIAKKKTSSLMTWSRPARALWIEMPLTDIWSLKSAMSRPARALWIEMRVFRDEVGRNIVEAREGLVD